MKADAFIDLLNKHGGQIKETCSSLSWQQKLVYIETLVRVMEKEYVQDNAQRLDIRLDRFQTENLAECMEKRNANA